MSAPLISTLPPAPSRADDPTNFSNKADAFVAALPAFGSSANTQAAYLDSLASEVDADRLAAAASVVQAANQVVLAGENALRAETAANVAAGAANYQGEYSAVVSYSTGQSVSYLGLRYIAKKTNLGITPVDGNDWLLLADVAPVLTFINQTQDVVLAANNGGAYVTVAPLNELSVVLPSANQTLDAYFTIKNASPIYTLVIKNAAGQNVQTIAPKTLLIIYANDKTTAAGNWTISLERAEQFENAVNTINAAATRVLSNNTISAISSSKAVKIYRMQELMYSVVVTNTAGVISYGPSTYLGLVSATNDTGSVSMLTATMGFAAFRNNANNGVTVVGFTVQGDVINFASTRTITAATANFINLVTLSASSFVVIYASNVNNTLVGVAYTVNPNGTVLIPGSVTTIVAGVSGVNYFRASALSATTFVIAHRSTNSQVIAVSVSGVTLTPGTATQLATGTNGYYAIEALSGSTLIAFYQSSTGTAVANFLTVSGTTITVNAQLTVNAATTTAWHSLAAINSTSALAVYFDGTNVVSNIISVTGVTLTTGATTALATASTLYHSLTRLQTPVVGNPSGNSFLSTFNIANVVEFVQNVTVAGAVITPALTKLLVEYSSGPGFSPSRADAVNTSFQLYISNQYTDDLRANVLYANLLDVNRSIRTAVEIEQGSGNYVALSMLTSTTGVVFYQTVAGTAVARVIQISGTSVSVGPALTVNANSSTFLSVSRVNDNQAIVYFSDNATSTAAAILTVSGNTLTAGTTTTISTGNFSSLSIRNLSATSAVVGYASAGTFIRALTISGNTISVGAEVITNDIGSFIAVRRLSDTKALVYDFTTTGALSSVRVVSVSGLTATVGADDSFTATIGPNVSAMPSIVVTSQNRAYVFFQSQTALSIYKVTISNDVPTIAAPVAVTGSTSNAFNTAVALRNPQSNDVTASTFITNHIAILGAPANYVSRNYHEINANYL